MTLSLYPITYNHDLDLGEREEVRGRGVAPSFPFLASRGNIKLLLILLVLVKTKHIPFKKRLLAVLIYNHKNMKKLVFFIFRKKRGKNTEVYALIYSTACRQKTKL